MPPRRCLKVTLFAFSVYGLQPVPVVQAWSVPLPPKAETRSSNEDPLMLAAYRGDATTVEALIGGYNVKTRNRYGETLLHLAASAPEGEAVKVSIEFPRHM
jgi:ankyrin repeat protein